MLVEVDGATMGVAGQMGMSGALDVEGGWAGETTGERAEAVEEEG